MLQMTNRFEDLSLAGKVRTLREERGWTQSQLAEISGLSERTVQRVEKKGMAALDTLQALASAFDISVKEIRQSEPGRNKFSPTIRHLLRLTSGKMVFDIAGGAHLFENGYDELKTDEEADLLSETFQYIQDYGDLWGDLDAGERIKIAFEFNKYIEELERLEFWIFGLRHKVLMKVGFNGENKEVPMEMSTFIIKRSNSSDILKVSLKDEVLPTLIK